jgi:hypothetical protein
VKPLRVTLFRTAATLITLTLGAAAVPAVPQTARAAAPATAEAQWIDRATVVWTAEHTPATTEELSSADGGTLRLTPASLTDAQKAAYPHLAARPAYRLDPRDRDKAATALRGPLAAVQRAAGDDGHVLHRTGVQIPGVLDDLYAARARRARLGPVFHGALPTLSVWAPTARSVSLDLDGRTVAMRRDARSGVWSVTGSPDWRGTSPSPTRTATACGTCGGWPGPAPRTSISCPPSTSPPSRSGSPTRRRPDCDPASYAADSDQQQECVAESPRRTATTGATTRYHYTVPEGSLRDRPRRPGAYRRVPADGQVAERGRAAGRHGRGLQPHRGRRSGGTRCSTGSCPATTSGCSPTAAWPTPPAAPTPRPRTR